MIELFDQYGWLFFAYLVLVGILGYRLLKDEKMMMFGRMAQTFSLGHTPAKAIFGSFKNMIAGILLMIPGVITDGVAVLLLLIPTPRAAGAANQPNFDDDTQTYHDAEQPAANDNVIEGEYRRED